MPLMGRRAFAPSNPSKKISEESEVYSWRLTGECFKAYEDYAKRVYETKQPIWTCSVSGTTRLTYEEALKSERDAKDALQHFPAYLEGPVLSLVQHHDAALIPLVGHVFKSLKNTFFLDETVDVIGPRKKTAAAVIVAILDDGGADTVEKEAQKENNSAGVSLNPAVLSALAATPAKGGFDGSPVNFAAVAAAADKNDNESTTSGPTASLADFDGEPNPVPTQATPAAKPARPAKGTGVVSYEVEYLDELDEDEFPSVVPANRIRHRKGEGFTQDNLKMFIREHATRLYPSKGPWIVEPTAALRYGIPPKVDVLQVIRKSLTKNPKLVLSKGLQGLYKAPKIERAKSKKTPQKGPKKKPRLSVGDSKKKPKAAKSPKKPKSKGIPKAEIIPVKKKSKMTKEEWEKVLKKARKAKEKRLAKEKEERRVLREKQREEQKAETIRRNQEKKERDLLEKQRLAEYMRPREDLELTDSKPLPEFTLMPASLNPTEVGNCMAVMQFLRLFGDALELERQIEHDFSYADLCAAVAETSPLGLLGDILMHLLVSVLDEDCAGEEEDAPIPFLRMDLKDVQLDTNTVTVVLHAFLTSHRARDFREESIVLKLQERSFFSLAEAEKLAVLNFLCEQLISHAAVQNCMVEAEDSAASLRTKLREDRTEAVAARRARLKELKQEYNEKMAQPAAAASTGSGAEVTSKDTAEDSPSAPAEPQAGKAGKDSNKKAVLQLQKDHRDRIKAEEDDFKKTMDAREAEVLDQLWELEAVYRGVQPLGRDRYFRRYWVCHAVPGLLVEPADASGKELIASTNHSAAADSLGDNWRFVGGPDELENVIDHLNARGLRENRLGENLVKYRSLVVKRMSAEETPAPATEIAEESSDADGFILAQLADDLIDLEERLFQGALLGSEWDAKRADFHELVQCEEKSTKVMMEAMSRLEAAIPRRYLKPPAKVVDGLCKSFYIGDTASSAKDVTGEEEAAAEGADDASLVPPKTNVELWRESVAVASSPSEGFLFFNVLNDSVVWKKSVLKTRCRICKKSGDAEKMLLCDKCDDGYHMYCMKPKMRTVPEGDWFCARCAPKAATPRKRRRSMREVEVESAEESASEDEPETASEEEEASSEEEEASEEEEEASEEEEEEEASSCASDGIGGAYAQGTDSGSSTDPNDDVCAACGEDGELMCCETCPRAFHTECVGLMRVPRGDWFCDHCKKKQKRAERESGPRGRTGGKSSRRGSGIDEDLMAVCQAVLRELETHPLSADFLNPVSKRDAPDYYKVVKKPMDFSTIKDKLNFLSYKSHDKFASDVRLVFSNAIFYNGPKHLVAKDAAKLSKVFEKSFEKKVAKVHKTAGKPSKRTRRLEF